MLEKLETLTHLPKQKLIRIIIITGCIALAGIFLSDSFSNRKSASESEQKSTFESENYREDTEKRLKAILSKIDGIGQTDVMITLESSPENIYCADAQTQTDSNEKSHSSGEQRNYVIIDNNGQTPVLEKEIQPKIRGVIVVCAGADNVQIKEAVIEAVSSGLGVSVSNISVLRGGKDG